MKLGKAFLSDEGRSWSVINDASAFRIPFPVWTPSPWSFLCSSPSHEFHLHSFPLFSFYWAPVIAWNLSPVTDVTRVEDPFSEATQYHDKYTKHDRIRVVITKLRLQSPLLRWHWYYHRGWCVQYSVLIVLGSFPRLVVEYAGGFNKRK